MQRVKLKAIKFGVDFRKNELTNYREFQKSKKFPGTLGKDEVFLFVSKSGNQLVFIIHTGEIETGTGLIRNMIDSRKWRIDGSSSWNPKMLQNYANELGMDLIGFRRLEDVYRREHA